MENAADALQMAAFVLIFVLALSISINAFGEVRQTAQMILDNKDRGGYIYTYITGNGNTKRIVGAETIIPSMYKAYKENYKIVFKNLDSSSYLYEKLIAINLPDKRKMYSIDLEQEVLGTDKQKEDFIKFLLYGWNTPQEVQIFTDAGLTLKQSGIYNTIIKNHKFEESLGIYYQEDLQGTSNEPEANKTLKRVITYTKQ